MSQWVVTVPGRVNLIGEHTDYNGLPVFPTNISHQVVWQVRARNDRSVIVRNEEPHFPAREFTLVDAIPPYETGDWGNYVKAGVQGVIRHFTAGNLAWRGFEASVKSTLPKAAGLSSSSAMVIAAALSLVAVNGQGLAGQELAEILARAERYVGTQGGGMDHAAILLGQPDHALLTDFFPLRTQPIPLPTGYRFVVCRSLVDAPKTQEARLSYNQRPMECRLAHAILRQALTKQGVGGDSERLGDLVKQVPDLFDVGVNLLGDEPWSLERVAMELQLSPQEVQARFLTLTDGSVFPEPSGGFQLGWRFRHVLLEGQRVYQAAAAIQDGDAQRFGELMNESHASCRDLYQISCPELDELVRIARAAGAIGARLTGAGFGGCTVSLVEEHALSDFCAHVWHAYYQEYLPQRDPEGKVGSIRSEDVILPVDPRGGATVARSGPR